MPSDHGADACRLRRSQRGRGEGKLRGQCLPAVYTVRFAEAVYVLHAFQKKSKKGIATPKLELDVIEKRLKDLLKDKERRQ